MPLHHVLDHCLLCRSTDLTTVLELEPIPIATPVLKVPAHLVDDASVYAGVPLALNLCTCGQIQVSHLPDIDFEYRNYVYTTSLSAGLRAHFEQFANEVFERWAPRTDGFVVECGSNDGTLLRHFAARGMRVLGIDPATQIAAAATAAGLETWGDFFNVDLAKKILAERGKASVFLANFVTANLTDMVDFAESVRLLLADDGIAVFETQYGREVISGNLLDTIYHEHISYYNVTPLVAHYKRHGLDVIAVKVVPTKGGSIRLTVAPAGSRPIDPSVAQLVTEEAAAGCGTPGFFAPLVRRIAAIRAGIAEIVAENRAAGRDVAAWGVSVGTSALLPQFGLSQEIAYVFDDDLNKDPELRGPDYRIPVLPGTDLIAKMPGAVVVFAWRYIEPIMKKHRDYLERGGTFVVPLPDLHVVRGANALPPNTIGV